MKSIILMVCCVVTLSATAQEKPAKANPWGKMKNYKPIMTKSIGVSFQDFNGLNSRIAGFPQYEQLKGHMYTISLGSMHNMKNFITQFNINGGSSLSGDPDEKSSAIRMMGLSFDLGYDVIPTERVMVYPMVGLGVEKYSALFYKDVNSVNFNDVINFPTTQNNIRSLKFKNTFMNYRLGLGIGFKAPDGNHSIGLQGMYIGSFKDNKAWRSAEEQSLTGAPIDDLQRISVSLVITGSMMGMHK